MATLPARRTSRGNGRNLAVVNPTREFEDIYDRMGQLMNLAFGSMMPTVAADLPWVPLGDISETDDAYVVRVDLPGVSRDQIDIQLQDRELIISGEIPDQQGQGQGQEGQGQRGQGQGQQGQGQGQQGQGQGQQSQSQQQDGNERRHRTQRPTGQFEFRAVLPGDVNPDRVTAQLRDGVLTVNIPKSEAAKPHHVEISD
ncbi:MAG TPA: Hsp20/alpha crystallin family protein [Streptosporangiaceae bacterium]|nr:Hsp20/alpha crystallin family protein [Streptosporangiaceae bacterium]